MQNIKKMFTMIVVIMGLMPFTPVFGMNGAQNQQIPQAAQPVCNICGQNDTLLQTVNNNKTTYINNGSWKFAPYRPYRPYKPHKRPMNRPVYHNHLIPTVQITCSHFVCINCVTNSRYLYPDANGCQLCPYTQARIQHIQCNMAPCNNPVAHIIGKTNHTHGLCNQHLNETVKLNHETECNVCHIQANPNVVNQHPLCEAAQCANNTNHIKVNRACTHHLCYQHNNNVLNFKHSPIDYIKDTLQSNNCTRCFIQNNPDVTSCETKTRYWGEMALITGGTSVVVYSAYKIYNWWQNRKKKQEEKEYAHAEEESAQQTDNEACEEECYNSEQKSATTLKRAPAPTARKTKKA